MTVGHQMPFDRLTSAVNEWHLSNPEVEVYGQVGEPRLTDINFDHVSKMPPLDFREFIRWADLVVSDAGMGTIISSLDLAKPVLVLPRKSSLDDTRNEHQFGTAKRLTDLGLIQSIAETSGLSTVISAIRSSPRLGKVETRPSENLLKELSVFISSERV